SLGDSFRDVFPDVVRIRIAVPLEPLAGKEPEEIGMLHLGGHPARPALATWSIRTTRVFAQQQPAEPQGDLLLADAARSLEEEARGQRVAPHGVAKPLLQRRVSVE